MAVHAKCCLCCTISFAHHGKRNGPPMPSLPCLSMMVCCSAPPRTGRASESVSTKGPLESNSSCQQPENDWTSARVNLMSSMVLRRPRHVDRKRCTNPSVKHTPNREHIVRLWVFVSDSAATGDILLSLLMLAMFVLVLSLLLLVLEIRLL